MDVKAISIGIRVLRVGRGHSQITLAREVGISPSTLSLIENGLRPVKELELARLLVALGSTRRDLECILDLICDGEAT